MAQVLAQEMADHHMSLANSKIPPTWSAERDKVYPLREYIRDLRLWSVATDTPEAKQAPAAALRLTGAAKLIIREMPTDLLTDGEFIFDPNTGIPAMDAAGNPMRRTGLEVLIRQLERRYGALDQETQIFHISELLCFARQPNESTDQMLARYDVLSFRAQGVGVVFPPIVKAWCILTLLRIPKPQWTQLLIPTQGMLPTTPQEYQNFIGYLRRNQHIFEAGGADRMKTIQQPFFAAASDSQVDPSQHSYFQQDSHHMTSQPHFTHASAYYDSSQYGHDMSAADDYDSISWHSFSTGMSDDNNHDDLTWEDTVGMSPDDMNEYLYLQYRFAKRRFRKVGFKRKRFFGKRRFGKGGKKGNHFKGKGSGHFWTDNSAYHVDPWTQHPHYPQAYHTDEVFYKGSGKGKGNPIGKDGKPMLCSICKSAEHFWKHCPQGKGKGKGAGHSPSTFPALTQNSSSSASSQAMTGVSQTTTVLNDQNPHQSRPWTPFTFFVNGTSQESVSTPMPLIEEITHTNDEALPISPARQYLQYLNDTVETLYPCWNTADDMQLAFHTKVRLESGEALLVDTGAINNLAGSRWIQRTSELAAKAGQGTEVKQIHGREHSVGGVGTGESKVTHEAVVPVAFEDGARGTYSTSVIADSDLPALLALDPMHQRRVMLDLINFKYYEVGPGGVKLTLSPGSRILDMHRAPTGHLLLPITAWNRVKPLEKQVTYVSK